MVLVPSDSTGMKNSSAYQPEFQKKNMVKTEGLSITGSNLEF